MMIFTHRGLDPDRGDSFPPESSREAFAEHLARGFGLEFDPRRAPDGSLIVAHRTEDIAALGRHLVTFRELLSMIRESGSAALHAVHLKADAQTEDVLKEICRELKENNAEQFLIFDLTIPSAQFLRRRSARFRLAPSVSHSYDIRRYNSAVGGTLFSLDEALAARSLFDSVWLDEWDRTDRDGGVKSLYTRDTFEKLRKSGFKIAFVSPELHATSPGLRGGEAHPDAATRAALKKRLAEIIALRPDAVCTDYPDMVRRLAAGHV